MSSKTSFEKDRIKFLLLEGVHQTALDTLKRNGYTNIEYHKKALAGDDLKSAIADAHFVGIRSRTQLTSDVFAEAKKLIGVGAFCIGTNQIDLEAAMLRGIPVFNAPYSNTRSVAELVLGQTILLMRGIPEKNAKAHRGEWVKSADNSWEVRGKTLGIVGYGSIGTQLSVLAEGVGMNVIFHDVVTKLPLGNARQVNSLDELLAQADVVTLHVPELPSTQMMMRREQFAKMKKGAIFMNAARGTCVDIDAAAEFLGNGHLAGAAFDVFPVEPKANDEEFVSPLRAFDNVLLTPHIGGSTAEAQANIGLEVSEKFVRYSDNGSTLTAVNFPEVALPEHPGSHRILHIHRNVPGMLSQINTVFSENRLNITGQYLMTNPKIGYVVIDIEAEGSLLALEKLSAIEGTIRARVLF